MDHTELGTQNKKLPNAPQLVLPDKLWTDWPEADNWIQDNSKTFWSITESILGNKIRSKQMHFLNAVWQYVWTGRQHTWASWWPERADAMMPSCHHLCHHPARNPGTDISPPHLEWTMGWDGFALCLPHWALWGPGLCTSPGRERQICGELQGGSCPSQQVHYPCWNWVSVYTWEIIWNVRNVFIYLTY